MLHSNRLEPPWPAEPAAEAIGDADQVMADCLAQLSGIGVIGLCFSGRPYCGARDWLNSDHASLFKRSQLLNPRASTVHPLWVRELQSLYLKGIAPQDHNFLRCLELHQPFVFQLDPGSKAQRVFSQHGVSSVVHWPMRQFSRPGWCGAFILLFAIDVPEHLFASDKVCDLLCQTQLQLFDNDRQRFNPYRQLGAFSPTSLTILQRVAEGVPNRLIAQEMYLSERGVDYHLECLKQKLGAFNRVHLVHLAHQFDLV